MKNRIMSLILAAIISVSAAAVVSAADATETPGEIYAKGVVFTEESGYVANTYTGTIDGAEIGVTTAGDLMNALENLGESGISFVRDGAVINADEVLQSGDKVVLATEDGTVKSEFAVAFVGDANSDSKLNINDASAMLKKIAKWDITLDEMMSDVNADGALNISDVSTVLKKVAKWDVEFVKDPVLPGKYNMLNKYYTPCHEPKPNIGLSPICLSDGIHYDLGVKFTVKEDEFATKLDFHCPSFADDKGSLTVSVYKWNGDYDSSIAAMPIITNTFVDFKDNATLSLDLYDASGKGLVAGEYVWRIHDGTDAGAGVGIYYYHQQGPAEDSGMKSFLNCKEFNIGPEAKVYYSVVY